MGSRVSVSVVIPVHDTLRYLPRCLESVAAQSLGQDRIEVIAVDDGSTDGSAAWLDAWAAGRPNTTVIHQSASGGAGRPRNTGIDRARGQYLFFLDSDDYLGDEALERLVTMADAHGSDIVYGRIIGIGGRPAPVDLRTTAPDVSIFDSPVYWTLAAYKLWRRSLVDGRQLRFTEGLLVGEDLPFAVHGLLHAAKVSVVADYDCYYLEGRGDGSNATRQDLDWPAQLAHTASVLELLAAHVPAGPDRDKLVQRHFHGEVLAPFGPPYLARDEAGRAAMAAAAAPLVDAWLTDRVLAALPPGLRLRAHLLRTGDPAALTAVVAADRAGAAAVPTVVDAGRAYAAYPGFRDPAAGLPDALFDLTAKVALRQELTDCHWDGPVLRLRGRAELAGMGPGPGHTAAILLRRQGTTYRVPAETDGEGHYRCAVDVGRAADGGPLPEGVWTLRIEVAADSLRKEAWLPGPADGGYGPEAEPDPEPRLVDRGRAAGATAVAAFLSPAHRHLNLDIGATRFPLGRDACGRVRRGLLGGVSVTASVTVPGCPAGARLRPLLTAPGRAPLLLRASAVPAADVDPAGRVSVRCRLRGLRGLPAGEWELGLRLEVPGFTQDLPVRAPDGTPLRVPTRAHLNPAD